VRVRLSPAPDTPSGYRWTSSRGPDLSLNAGTLVRGRVTVKRERVIGLFLPQAEQVL
jgi:HlyD family secretion protein